MQVRDFSFRQVKALDYSSGSFTGLASTYSGPPDLQGDVIERGAFAMAIKSQGDGVPLLWSHAQESPLGVAKLSDSKVGLVVDGSMVMEDPAAQRAYAHLKAGSIKGLSIGFSLPPESSGKVTYGADGTRIIRELKLWEVSLVAIPANPRAVVTSVKSLAQVETVLRNLHPGQVSDADLEQLQSISASLKALLRKEEECDCDNDPNCDSEECEEKRQKARAAEELALMKSFAASLKSMTGRR